MPKWADLKKSFLLYVVLLGIMSNHAIADTQQEILEINAIIGLNPLMGRIRLNTNDIPISIVTNDTGKIEAVVMGDQYSRMNYSDFFGSNNGVYDIPVTRFAMNQLSKPIFITEKLLGKTANLAMIDGSKLDPMKGGDLRIGIPESMISHDHLQIIELTIKKDPVSGKWAAFQKGKEEKAITRVSVSGDKFGFGISSPQYKTGGEALQTLQRINQTAPASCQGVGICLSYYKNGSVIFTKAYKKAEDFQKEPMFALPISSLSAVNAK